MEEVERHSSRFPMGRWSNVEVILKDGRSFHSEDVHARGGPESPMEDEEVEEKFHTMTSSALSKERSQAIWQMRNQLLLPNTQLKELSVLLYDKCDV